MVKKFQHLKEGVLLPPSSLTCYKEWGSTLLPNGTAYQSTRRQNPYD